MDWLQLFADYLSSLIADPLVAQLAAGAAEGVVVGMAVGAVVWAIMKAPDTLGRALFLGILLGIAVMVWEIARIGAVMGMGMGGIIDSLSDNVQLGRMFLAAGVHTLTAMFVGALIGVGSRVPNYMIYGGIIGLFLGALAGAALRFGLYFFGVRVNLLVFRGLVSLGTWALLATFSGK